jgi:uncharacterized caspase-like protein
MMQSARGVAIKAKKDALSGKMVVFSATESGQTAYPLKDKEHGLFTYYILESLQKNGGCITLGELSDRVTKLVDQTSVIENEKKQTPTIASSPGAADWRNWQFAPERAKRYETMEKPQVGNSNVATPSASPTTTAQPATTQPKQKRSFLRPRQ